MAIERAIDPRIGGQTNTRRDRAVAALAGRQHGLVARVQLTAIGLGPRAVELRVSRAQLTPIHRGVYAVGHRALTREARWMAAVLAAGPEAVLSHRDAAALWGIRQSGRATIEVTCPRQCRRPGVEAHRSILRGDEVTTRRGIPVTTAARTLLDLAAVVSADQLEHAFNQAEVLRLTSPTSLPALVARHPGRRGATAIRQALAKHAAYGETPTRSEIERRFLTLIDAHGLPRPKINRFTDQGELDATWPEQRLVVELDGFATHGTREAFERDRARDRALTAAGWRVVRITWRQLTTDAATIAAQLSALLGAPPASDRSPPPRSARRGPPRPPATPATRSAAA